VESNYPTITISDKYYHAIDNSYKNPNCDQKCGTIDFVDPYQNSVTHTNEERKRFIYQNTNTNTNTYTDDNTYYYADTN
jgi:hypothetical protein